MDQIIQLSKENIDTEHICCAFSDKKCTEGYQAKKKWLKSQFELGYKFIRLDARAKVFLEYGPAEHAWAPVSGDNYYFLNCFWVSGRYKKQGYAKELIRMAVDDAKEQRKSGLFTVAGKKKNHFMSDGKWLKRQGFESVAETKDGFELLVLKLDETATNPEFMQSAIDSLPETEQGIVVYYSDRCPFTDFHVNVSLKESAEKRNITFKTVKLDSVEKAQSSPSPATVFTMYRDGKFVTTDLSVCMDSRFDKIMDKANF